MLVLMLVTSTPVLSLETSAFAATRLTILVPPLPRAPATRLVLVILLPTVVVPTPSACSIFSKSAIFGVSRMVYGIDGQMVQGEVVGDYASGGASLSPVFEV